MKINLITPYNQLGYGVAGSNLFKSLVRLGNEVALFPMGNITADERDKDIINQGTHRSKMPDWDAPCVRIWHQNDMSMMVGRGPKYGMPIFELDTFSEVEQHHLGSLDKIIVNSEWARQIVIKELGTENVDVVPLGYDPDIFKPVQNHSKTCVFLNMGKWEIRKGHDVLCDIFNKAFTQDDDVELWMCNNNPFYTEEENKEWEQYYTDSPLGNKVRIIPRLPTAQDVANLMQQADCGVFPSRGEGWNLEALEMLACGKQIIATNYSAHTEFLNDESYLVDIDELESAYDGKWFFGQGNWAKIGDKQIDMFVEHMRGVYKLKQAGEAFNSQGIERASDFTWDKAGEKLCRILS